MVESIASYLGSYSTNPLFSAISAINDSSVAQSTSKISSENVEDIFNQIIDEMDKNIEKNISQSTEEKIPPQNLSDTQFGPPAGLEIEGLDYNSLNYVEETDNSTDSLITSEVDIKEYVEKYIRDEIEATKGSDITSKEDFEMAHNSSASNETLAGGGGGGEEQKDDEEDNPMDLNGDGEVTTQEMLTYLGIKDSYGSSSSTTQETSAIDEILDMIV